MRQSIYSLSRSFFLAFTASLVALLTFTGSATATPSGYSAERASKDIGLYSYAFANEARTLAPWNGSRDYLPSRAALWSAQRARYELSMKPKLAPAVHTTIEKFGHDGASLRGVSAST